MPDMPQTPASAEASASPEAPETDAAARFDAKAAAWDTSPHRRKLTADIIAAMDRAGVFREPVGDALDFGCGTGLLTLELSRRCQRVTGLDFSAGMLAALDAKIEAADLQNVATILADLAAGDPFPGRYDLVTSAMVLHHVPDLAPVLTRLFGALQKGGRLALADLDAEGGAFHDDNEGVHHFGFDRLELADTLAGLGFADIDAATAATIEKPAKCGTVRPFTVFLMTAKRP
ncbi:MAG: class I SAM-dependent DNA methyltransferase [Solidesulfovibrio sp. DCME]|uniref:class I SAM-dependent DNA methyltransferase n=1 Tax=Solidesulfovibrio sp. DCME TaxID=3447380 RepID=UPI003D0BBCE3